MKVKEKEKPKAHHTQKPTATAPSPRAAVDVDVNKLPSLVVNVNRGLFPDLSTLSSDEKDELQNLLEADIEREVEAFRAQDKNHTRRLTLEKLRGGK